MNKKQLAEQVFVDRLTGALYNRDGWFNAFVRYTTNQGYSTNDRCKFYRWVSSENHLSIVSYSPEERLEMWQKFIDNRESNVCD